MSLSGHPSLPLLFFFEADQQAVVGIGWRLTGRSRNQLHERNINEAGLLPNRRPEVVPVRFKQLFFPGRSDVQINMQLNSPFRGRGGSQSPSGPGEHNGFQASSSSH